MEEQAIIQSPKKKEITLSETERKSMEQIYDIGDTKTVHSKREVPLTKRAILVLQYLKELHQENGWYQLEQLLCYDGKEYVARTTKLERELKALCKRAGISSYRVHPHLLRKTVATMLHEAGMSTRDIADLLGHSDMATTEQCYIISSEAKKETTEDVSSIIKGLIYQKFENKQENKIQFVIKNLSPRNRKKECPISTQKVEIRHQQIQSFFNNHCYH